MTMVCRESDDRDARGADLGGNCQARKVVWEEVIVVEGTKVRGKTERPREDYSAGAG